MATQADALIAYVPVIHRGYLDLFTYCKGVETAYILSEDITHELDYLRKDLRAISPATAVKIISSLGIFKSVRLLDKPGLDKLAKTNLKIIMPDEDISREIAKKYFSSNNVKLYPVFLRWDRRNVDHVDETDSSIKLTKSEIAKKLMTLACQEATKSSDIWRRVGAVLVNRDGEIISLAHNTGEPNQQSPLIEGDPRNVFKRGVGLEMSVFSHAEANLIAYAAKNGIKTDGCKIYVTTFPCPICAKLLAKSGISACYFSKGYAVLDGKNILDDYGVKLARVEGVAELQHEAAWRAHTKG